MLVASELYDAADALRTASSRTRSRGDYITDHSSDLTSQGFNGTAADAGRHCSGVWTQPFRPVCEVG